MEETSTGKAFVEQLMKLGWSKYRIAKELSVSWQTVNNWYRGRFQPSQTYAVKLEKLTK